MITLDKYFEFPLVRQYFKVYDQKGRMVLDVRSWGYLTGKGALGLSDEEATDIQDKWGDEIVTALNAAHQNKDQS